MARKANVVTVVRLLKMLELEQNVLLIGKHGVGKTALVLETFKQAGLKHYRIFSAATMDPWVDFIGVPFKQEDGKGAYLDIAPPKDFRDDNVEAIFMDEYNRAPKKVRNAIMELAQFKSINGRKFKNLKVVWAAVNPDDDEDDLQYDVEKIDPAQLDRFHIQLTLPYKPSRSFFQNKFGEEMASAAINWWNTLTQATKLLVSPRRLEYALDWHKVGGHLEEVLPYEANHQKLRTALQTTPILTMMNKYAKQYNEAKEKLSQIKEKIASSVNMKDTVTVAVENESIQQTLEKDFTDIKNTIRDFLSDENNYDMVVPEILPKTPLIGTFVPLMPEEKIAALITAHHQVRAFFCRHYLDYSNIHRIMQEIVDSGVNDSVCRELKRTLNRSRKNAVQQLNAATKVNENRVKPYYHEKGQNPKFKAVVEACLSTNLRETYTRGKAYNAIIENIPEIMSEDEATTCLSILDCFIRHSHGPTIKRYTYLMGMTNHCIINLLKYNWEFKQFAKKYPALSEYVVTTGEFYFAV